MNDQLQQIKDAVVKRQKSEIQGLVKMAIDEGSDPNAIIEDGSGDGEAFLKG
jgi:methanogenic corrinoid protein MtbC1